MNHVILILIIIVFVGIASADSFDIKVTNTDSSDYVYLNITGENLTIREIHETDGNVTKQNLGNLYNPLCKIQFKNY